MHSLTHIIQRKGSAAEKIQLDIFNEELISNSPFPCSPLLNLWPFHCLVSSKIISNSFLVPACQYLHISMKLEFISLIANSEVALGYSRLCCLKSHLVACQPPLVAKHESSTYWRARNIKIHVTADVDVLPFVPRLNFSTLFPKEKRKISYLCKGTPVDSNSIVSLQQHITLTQCNSSWRQCVHPWKATWHVTFLVFTFTKS